jgi:hypothetical protein
MLDSRGRPPQHTFFYPIECYQADHIDLLTILAKQGFGDVEVHLHHDNDSPQKLYAMLLDMTATLHARHDLLSRDQQGRIRYGFVHGNWALDNSHPDGRWCGVNNELSILAETGCYADFTMPAAPHAAQVRTINSVYYAVDDPQRPNSHDKGLATKVGRLPPSESLLCIQGPLIVSRVKTGSGSRLSVENGNLSATQPPTRERLMNWLRARVGVQGRDDWLFVKLHTHGAKEANADVLLGEPMRNFHASLRQAAEERGFHYYYVTTREMAQLVHQAEQGAISPHFSKLDWQ